METKNEDNDIKVEFEIIEFVIACDSGNYNLINKMLSIDKSLVNAKLPYNDLNLYAYNPGCFGIHYAVRSGHFNVVKLLINKYNAKFKQVSDHENWNCLHYSCFNGHFDSTKYLFQHGMQYKTITKFEKKTPFQFAFHRKFFDLIDIVPKYNYFGKIKSYSNDNIESILAKTKKKLMSNRNKQINHINHINQDIIILNRYKIKGKVLESLVNIICDNKIYDDGVIVLFETIDMFLYKINKNVKKKNDYFDSRMLFCIYYNRQQRINHVKKLKSMGINVIRSGSISGLHHILLVENDKNNLNLIASLCVKSKLMLID